MGGRSALPRCHGGDRLDHHLRALLLRGDWIDARPQHNRLHAHHAGRDKGRHRQRRLAGNLGASRSRPVLRGARSLAGDLAGLQVAQVAEPARVHPEDRGRVSDRRRCGMRRWGRARPLCGTGRVKRREHILLEGRGRQRDRVAGRVREAQTGRRGGRRVPRNNRPWTRGSRQRPEPRSATSC